VKGTYSFRNITGAFTHTLGGAYTFEGQQGIGTITIHMTTEKSAQTVAADGFVQTSFVAGDNGTLTIQTPQTSDFNVFLLNWFNDVKTAAKAGDASAWATGTMLMRDTLNNVTHVITGISPQNMPDKPYAAQGGEVTWVLQAADIQSENV
jgi:hypothetical protein